jgi:putative hydrolase of the HAD superfamily
LWDFDKNSRDTLEDIFTVFKLYHQHGFDLEKFFKAYMKTNEKLWESYRKNKVSKEVLRDRRFFETLNILGVKDRSLAEEISAYYLLHCPLKQQLLPYVPEVLDYLSERYQLHIITNGFGDAQRTKLEITGIGKYFDCIVISEEVGHKKPSRKIFESAVSQVNGLMEQSLMVGDDLRVDIRGAAGAGMDQVYFNPAGRIHRYRVTYQVSCLSELRTML